jgi:hypothetical protein
LQQVWHFRERTLFPIGGKALFPFALARFGFRIIVHNTEYAGYKTGIQSKNGNLSEVIKPLQTLVAHVAELADALDSGSSE